MIAPQLETPRSNVRLIQPNIERDAQLSLSWLKGELGKNTLSLMGATNNNNSQTTLENEQERIKDFIEKDDQLNWMIQLGDKVVGSIWVDLKPTIELPAPAVHIMTVIRLPGDKESALLQQTP